VKVVLATVVNIRFGVPQRSISDKTKGRLWAERACYDDHGFTVGDA
jgi:hypothetical protein